MNARLYDAKLHRFVASDNFIQDASNPQNYNRYGYVLNNPLKYNDPSGEFFIELRSKWYDYLDTIIPGAINNSKYNNR